MQAEELIAKALEVEQLEWWMEYPTLLSFCLRREWSSSDEGDYWSEQSEGTFLLSTDIYDPYEFDEDNRHWDYENHPDFSVSTYPYKRCGEFYERISRPEMTDTEMKARIADLCTTQLTTGIFVNDMSGGNITGMFIEVL